MLPSNRETFYLLRISEDHGSKLLAYIIAPIKKYDAEKKIRRIIDWLLQFKYFSYLRIAEMLHSFSLCQ